MTEVIATIGGKAFIVVLLEHNLVRRAYYASGQKAKDEYNYQQKLRGEV